MKTVAILLAVVCALCAVVFFNQKSTAVAALNAGETNRVALSNQVETLRTRLALAEGTLDSARSNHQFTLDQRTARALFYSNRLVQANLEIQNAQTETRALRGELQALAYTNGLLEARGGETSRQAKAITDLEARLKEARGLITSLTAERDRLASDLQLVRLERAELARKLDDPAFLRTQTEKAEDNAAVRKRMATRPVNSSDERLQVELLPDGSVRAIPPPNAPGAN
jgi:chromosome segregation ATPase